MTVYDAHGNPVAENGVCVRCGASIKYVYEYNGQTYGSTCIERILGIAPEYWVVNSGKVDDEATQKKFNDAQDELVQQQLKNQEVEEKMVQVRKHNSTRYNKLINVLKAASQHNGDFCSQMAGYIENATVSIHLYEGILSPNQFDYVRLIWGKETGGRRGSKKFEAAVAEFDEKFDEPE